ncbi:4-hydroxy-2-oxovalerate aldolase [Facilibium subflavum]|uniref:4-hydroxy-2-oxovalerate aldolase n=1 Tax=Facilibium subflavum TaxID=2219058 RepID=UPI000E64F496|nr:4-hydroxy-2-oxovalerate aldolase [Facilibium subflavum]
MKPQTKKIIISDPTLRDGNHAIKHQLSLNEIKKYLELIDKTGVDIIEIGHGNGLGASSLQLGESLVSDKAMLSIARESLSSTKLGIHIIPGFGRLSDLQLAVDEGVDVIRVASHCTEADTTERYIKFAHNAQKIVFGVLMMSHMTSKESLFNEARKMQDYGAEAIIIMDSAGAYLPEEVYDRIAYLVSHLEIKVGFHGHNNLSMAVSNSIMALKAGATLLDACICGFGAGAGNTALEVLVAVLYKYGYKTSIDFNELLKVVKHASNTFVKQYPMISELSLASGMHGVFSGFAKPVKQAADAFGVSELDIFASLGRKKVIAGQEDLIIEVAQELAIKATHFKECHA